MENLQFAPHALISFLSDCLNSLNTFDKVQHTPSLLLSTTFQANFLHLIPLIPEVLLDEIQPKFDTTKNDRSQNLDAKYFPFSVDSLIKPNSLKAEFNVSSLIITSVFKLAL